MEEIPFFFIPNLKFTIEISNSKLGFYNSDLYLARMNHIEKLEEGPDLLC